MSRKDFSVLASPAFLLSLSLLLLNDFLLKHIFHNWLTGKLSDFAGLFVFSLFCSVFFPRHRLPLYLLLAIVFVLWKSQYSEPLIEVWNGLGILQVSRTVDYGDLIALVALPLSYTYSSRYPHPEISWKPLYSIAAFSLFAFAATSYSHDHHYDNQYLFQDSKAELINKIKHLSSKHEPSSFLLESDSDRFNVHFDDCVSMASIMVSEVNGLGVIRLSKINFRCPGGGDKAKLLGFFEKEFIDKLKNWRPNEPTEIVYIFPADPDNKQPQETPR